MKHRDAGPRIIGAILLLYLLSETCLFAQVQESGDKISLGGGSTFLKERNSYKPVHWGEKWLTPQQYLQAYEYVQRMPDERDFKPRNRVTALSKWEGIGPSRVKLKNTDRFYWHGRVRSFKWYYNRAIGDWERYLGASSGGLWFPNPEGLMFVWTSLGDNLPNPAVGAIEIHPDNRDIIFVGTGDWTRYTGAGLFKTTNRGSTWTHIPLTTPSGEAFPNAITSIFYSPGSTTTLYLSSNVGVFKSTDGGNSWNRLTVDPAYPDCGVFNMVKDPSRSGVLYAALTLGWGWGPGIYKTTNGGTSWSPVNNGFPTNGVGSTLALDISISNPSILYAAVPNDSNNIKAIYKTTNGGTSWSPTPTPYYMNSGQGFHANVIKIHPTNPNIVYAGSVGFIRTTNGGTSWQYREAGHADLTVLEFSPYDPNFLAVGNDGGIFYYNDTDNNVVNLWDAFTPSSPIQAYGLDYAWSESNLLVAGTQDNGTMLTDQAFQRAGLWISMSGCDGGNEINVDRYNPSILYWNSWCGAANPRFRSTDKGENWTEISHGLKQVYYTPLKLEKAYTNYLFTVTDENLYYSTNRGDSWSRACQGTGNDFLPSEPPKLLAVNWAPALEINCYVGFWEPAQPLPPGASRRIKIAHGTPGNMTWLSVNLPGNEIIHGISVDRWNSFTAYAFTDGPPFRVYRTMNYGLDWQNITGNLPDVNQWDLVTHPTYRSTLYVSTDLGVFKTTNSGETWYKFQYGLPIVAVNRMVYVPGSAPDRLGDTLRISTFGRGFWQRVLSSDDPLFVSAFFGGFFYNLAVATVVPLSAIAVSDSGLVARTTDGGMNWTLVRTGIEKSLRGTSFSDPNTATAVGESGTILRTTDGGESWYPVKTPTKSTLHAVQFINMKEGWACGDGGSVIKTEDGGDSWSSLVEAKQEILQALFFLDSNNGWVAGTVDDLISLIPVLRRTTDGGKTWTQSKYPGGPINCIRFVDGKIGFAVGDGGLVMKTTDGGETWEPLKKVGVEVPLYGCCFSDEKTGWVCGAKGTVLKTKDGGESWMLEESGVEEELRSIALAGDKLLIAGSGVLSRRDLELTGVSDIVSAMPGEFELRQNYPNPFNPTTNIGYAVASKKYVNIKVYDVLGREVRELVNEFKEAGRYLVVWNGLNNFGNASASGVYFYVMRAGTHLETKRMVLLR
jgi:photosystem II stability/assembly factor-like uncharacterized protein